MAITMLDSTAEQGEIEREIGELVHHDVVDARNHIEVDNLEHDNGAAADPGSLLQRIAAGAVHEIDVLISELQITRERLVVEAERVHRELADYAALSQSAMQATKLIAKSLHHSKQIADAPSIASEDWLA